MTVQKSTFHTHTTFSDGINSVEEMLQKACELGFEEYGITDHCIIHKNIKKGAIWDREILRGRTHMFDNSFDDFEKRAKKHIKNIRQVAKNYPIKTYIGFEVDFFTYEGWLDSFQNMIKNLDIDYLISGNHYITLDEIDEVCSVRRIREYGFDEQTVNHYISKHFKDMVKAINSGIFDFIAHLDFIRYGNICGEHCFKAERLEVIKALQTTNTAFELSTKGLNSLGDFYPANWMLQELHQRNVPIIISDDAHRSIDIAQHFEKAESLLKSMNYKTRWFIK